MSLSKELIHACMVDQRDMVENAQIQRCSYFFVEKGCYVFVGIRHVGKSYLLY